MKIIKDIKEEMPPLRYAMQKANMQRTPNKILR